MYTADWLSCHNHEENQDQEIAHMDVSIHTINTAVDVPIYMSIEGIKSSTEEDAEL